MITVKWLRGEELVILEPFIAKYGWSPIDHRTAVAVCMYDGDKLIGFNTLQFKPMVGPLYVDKDHRGSGVAEDLSGMMADFLVETDTPGFMAIADSPVSEHLCESHGMKRVTSPVYMM